MVFKRCQVLASLVALCAPLTGAVPRQQQPSVQVTGTVELTSIDGEAVENRGQVVVFLEGPALREGARSSRGAAVLQVGGVFEPSVLPVIRGSTIHFPNDDRIFHNIFSLSAPRPFDLGVYRAGESRSVDFPNAGLVRLFCNIHPDMAASVLVLENPYFATTDELGQYTIPDVPAGTYTLRTWHEFGGETRQQVLVQGPQLRLPPIRIQEDRTVLPHLNKFGRRYGGKYGG